MFPSKNQMRRYAQRKAFHQWKREAGIYKNETHNNGHDRHKKIDISGFQLWAIPITLVALFIFGLIFKVTWLWVGVLALPILLLLIAFPVLLVITLIIGTLIVFSFLLT